MYDEKTRENRTEQKGKHFMEVYYNDFNNSGKMTDILDSVVKSTEEIAVSVEFVSAEIVNQAKSPANITSGLDEITGVIQTTSEVSKQSAVASTQLTEQA